MTNGRALIEERILSLLRDNDEYAVNLLYDYYYTSLSHYATTITGVPDIAEEVVNDVILYMWMHRQEIAPTSLTLYLLKAVKNACLNEIHSRHFRMTKARAFYLSDDNLHFFDHFVVDTDTPFQQMVNGDLEKRIEEAINKLPAQCQSVFVKSRYEHKRYEEIAKELNISTNTVKYHIKNALQLLHKHLKDYLIILMVYVFNC